jgi:hypothetical protein
MWTAQGGCVEDCIDIRITVEGRALDRAAFCIPTMSIHRADAGYVSRLFELRVPVDDLITVMERLYAAFVREMKEDDDLTGEAITELANAGYPATIRDLLAHPEALDIVMGDYLVTEFLTAISWPTVHEPRHWYLGPKSDHHRTSCTLDGGDVVFAGQCVTRADAPAPRDESVKKEKPGTL